MPDTFAAYCGLHCENCYQRAKIGPEAARLLSSMRRLDYERFGHMIPDFPAFWNFLTNLTESGGCRGCRGGGGNPYCKIRICAEEKENIMCAACGEYPCGEFADAFRHYPMLQDDNRLLLEKGWEKWSAMQAERCNQNYTYTDSKE